MAPEQHVLGAISASKNLLQFKENANDFGRRPRKVGDE